MPEPQYLATRNIQVDLGEKLVPVAGGSELPKETPEGALKSLLSTGWAVEASEFQSEPDEGSQPIQPEGDPQEPETTWLDTEVNTLDLNKQIVTAYADAGLTTVRSILEFGEANDGDLTKVKGISESSAARTQQVIDNLLQEQSK